MHVCLTRIHMNLIQNIPGWHDNAEPMVYDLEHDTPSASTPVKFKCEGMLLSFYGGFRWSCVELGFPSYAFRRHAAQQYY